MNKDMPLKQYTDTKSLFDSLTTLNTTTEKCLRINLAMLRESYEKREIADIHWITTNQNPADALKQRGAFDALDFLIATNKFGITPTAWIELYSPTWTNTIPQAIAKFAHFQKSQCCESIM